MCWWARCMRVPINMGTCRKPLFSKLPTWQIKLLVTENHNTILKKLVVGKYWCWDYRTWKCCLLPASPRHRLHSKNNFLPPWCVTWKSKMHPKPGLIIELIPELEIPKSGIWKLFHRPMLEICQWNCHLWPWPVAWGRGPPSFHNSWSWSPGL